MKIWEGVFAMPCNLNFRDGGRSQNLKRASSNSRAFDQTGFATNSAGKGNCPIAPLGSADPEL